MKLTDPFGAWPFVNSILSLCCFILERNLLQLCWLFGDSLLLLVLWDSLADCYLVALSAIQSEPFWSVAVGLGFSNCH